MLFDSSLEFTEFCYRYAYKEGFEMFIKSNTLKKDYKDIGVNRKGIGKLESKPHMMDA